MHQPAYFVLNENGSLLSSDNVPPEVLEKITADLHIRFDGNFSEIKEFIDDIAFVYNKIDNSEWAWYVNFEGGKYTFNNVQVKTQTKQDLAIALEEVHNQSKIDYKRIIIRKYSHDLSNLLTVLLINLGYLKDEMDEGNITTSNDEVVNQIVNSSLKTSMEIKRLIEVTRSKNEWNPDMVQGWTNLHDALMMGFEIVRYQIKSNTLLIANLPAERMIAMDRASLLRCLRIVHSNAINATSNLKLCIFELISRENENYDIFCLRDNGREFNTNKIEFDLTAANSDPSRAGLGLTNLKKLISLIHGEVDIVEGERKCISFKIPKKIYSPEV